MILFDIFLSFFKIGLFSFGGGYAMIPLIRSEVIDMNSWMTRIEFLDMLAIAQITPGPIAINTATFVGYRVSGIIGAAIATIAVVLPSLVIVTILSIIIKRIGKSEKIDFLYKGLRPIVLALIFSALVSIGRDSIVDLPGVFIALLCFVLLKFRSLNILIIIVLSGILGLIFY